MTPIVLVHGFMGGSAQWDGLRAALAPDLDVVAIDLPGFGANSHLQSLNSIEGYATWVIEQAQDRGLHRYHVLGHSMGGMIAQEIARKDSDRVERLVLYATGAQGALPGRFETIEESKRRATVEGNRATARRIAATWFLKKEASPDYEACARIAEQASLDAIYAGLDAMRAWSGEAALSEIEQETLIMWGDKDRTYAWEQTQLLWKNIPHASLAVIPGCAHAIHLEKPQLFHSILQDFLASTV